MAEQRLITKSLLTAIANAIRAKAGTSNTYTPSEMATAIADIETGTDVSDTTAVAADVVSGDVFYSADGTKTSGTLAANSVSGSWSGATYTATATAGYSKSSKTASTTLTTLTPSNSSPATISAGSRYYASASGKAISSYSSVTPSESGASFASGFNKMSAAGYAYTKDMTPRLLWTNSSPTSNFAAQTISLDLSEYDGVLIAFANSTTWTDYISYAYIPKGVSHNTFAGGAVYVTSSSSVSGLRNMTNVTDAGVSFGSGIRALSTSASVSNAHGIPLYIYGVSGLIS